MLLLAIAALSSAACAQPASDDNPISFLPGATFTDTKISLPALKAQNMTIAFFKHEQTGELRAKVGYENSDRGEMEYIADASARAASNRNVEIALPKNRFGLERVEATIERKNNIIFWQTKLSGKLHYQGNKTTPFSAADERGDELQGKPGCFARAGDAGWLEGELEVRLAFAEDTQENENLIASKAGPNDWTLVARELDYKEKTDVFTITTQPNGELRALDLLSKEARVICATRVSAPSGAPDFEIREIPVGTVLGSPMALPRLGLPVVQKWLEDFFKGSPVRISDVRLGRGAQYIVSVNGPSPKIKFDNDDGAWIQLNLLMKVGSNAGSSGSLVDTINIQIQDAFRAKAPTGGKEPPEQLYEQLKYSQGLDQTKTDWGKRMDAWQRTFATFLAAKYGGQLVGNQ